MWLVWMLGGCDVLERLLPHETVHIEMKTASSFRDGDPRKRDLVITGLDAEGCDQSFAFYSEAAPPSPAHTTACSELVYTPGPTQWDGTCSFYCEITGPL